MQVIIEVSGNLLMTTLMQRFVPFMFEIGWSWLHGWLAWHQITISSEKVI